MMSTRTAGLLAFALTAILAYATWRNPITIAQDDFCKGPNKVFYVESCMTPAELAELDKRIVEWKKERLLRKDH